MKIIKLKLEKFRAYKNEVEIDFDDLSVFVGKNDIGKSTILEALDIFFTIGRWATPEPEPEPRTPEHRTQNTRTTVFRSEGINLK